MTLRGCLQRPVTVPPSGIRRWLLRPIFDAHGVRAAVRAGLFIVTLALIGVLVALAVRGVIDSVPLWHQRIQAAAHRARTVGMPAWLLIMNESILLACVLLATWIMTALEGRRMSAVGLQRRQVSRDLMGGFVVGACMLSALVGALLALGFARLEAPTAGVGAALESAVAWLVACLLIGCAEESAFRGYLLTVLNERYGFWTAAIVVTALFMGAHGFNVGENPTGLLTVGVVSVLFCLAIRRTGTLWWVIGCHASWDWAESFFFGSADSGGRSVGRLFTLQPHGNIYLSGGADGPEGSVLCLVVLVATIALLPLLVRRRAGAGAPAAADA